jgi:hypothetical protein
MPNETVTPAVETDAPVEVTQTVPPAPEVESIFSPQVTDLPSPAALPEAEDVQADDAPFAAILKDVRRAARRSGNTKGLGALIAREFSQETYPLLEAMLEAVDERVGRLENAFDEIVEQTESFLQPDLSLAVAQVFNLGKAIASIVLQFKAGQKMTAEGEKKLHALAQQYLMAVDPVAKALAEATLDPNADDDEEEVVEEEVSQ